jgi:plasmid maintenance system antidote protein VapI
VLKCGTRPSRPNLPEFWLNAQRAVDLWDAAEAIRDEIESIKPLTVA